MLWDFNSKNAKNGRNIDLPRLCMPPEYGKRRLTSRLFAEARKHLKMTRMVLTISYRFLHNM